MIPTVDGNIRGCPKRDYATIPTPEKMAWDTNWPIPAPEAIRAELDRPMRGMWIDHVPDGAEIAAWMLRYYDEIASDPNPANTRDNPLVSGKWSEYRYIWMMGHPEEMGPQRVMPDEWFDHPEAEKPPPQVSHYTPERGGRLRGTTASNLSGSRYKREALKLSDLWRQGSLSSRDDIALSNHVLREVHPYEWYCMILDEEWTMRRAAQILREARVCNAPVCSIVNRWALPPPGTPAPRSSPPETAREIHDRCFLQNDYRKLSNKDDLSNT